jgi:hypothetical protein
MEPIEVCLRSKEGRDLVLRVPAAFLDAVIRDGDGRAAFVHWELWMLPDPRPPSQVAELQQSVPPRERSEFYKANEVFRILISLSSELVEKGRYESMRREVLEHNERLADELFGLEHFTRRPCKPLKAGSGIPTSDSKKCAEGGAYDSVYFGRSNVSNQRVLLNCRHSGSHCDLRTTLRGRGMRVTFPREGLAKWRWYEISAHKFLETHVLKAE